MHEKGLLQRERRQRRYRYRFDLAHLSEAFQDRRRRLASEQGSVFNQAVAFVRDRARVEFEWAIGSEQIDAVIREELRSSDHPRDETAYFQITFRTLEALLEMAEGKTPTRPLVADIRDFLLVGRRQMVAFFPLQFEFDSLAPGRFPLLQDFSDHVDDVIDWLGHHYPRLRVKKVENCLGTAFFVFGSGDYFSIAWAEPPAGSLWNMSLYGRHGPLADLLRTLVLELDRGNI
jgi:hypothetical protein